MSEPSKESKDHCRPSNSLSRTSCCGDSLQSNEGSEAACANGYTQSHSRSNKTVLNPFVSSLWGNDGRGPEVTWANLPRIPNDHERPDLSSPFPAHSSNNFSKHFYTFPQNGALAKWDQGRTSARNSDPIESSRGASQPASACNMPNVLQASSGDFCVNFVDGPVPMQHDETVAEPVDLLGLDGAEGPNSDDGMADVGYAGDLDGCLESSSDSPAPQRAGSGSGAGYGIHFSFEMDAVGAGEDGDFIDADIPRNCNGSSQFSLRSNDSMTSSYEELTSSVILNDNSEMTRDNLDLSQENIAAGRNMALLGECSKRVLNYEVNNLSQAGMTQTPMMNMADSARHVSQNPLSQSNSMNFEDRKTGCQKKSWRWSESDAGANFLSSLPAAASLTSDSSYGTPSAPPLSPQSIDDDYMVLSSPDAPGLSQMNASQCSRGPGHSENRGHLKILNEDFRLSESLNSSLESCSNCESCDNLFENMNRAKPKHLFEKVFGWETNASSSLSAASKYGKRREKLTRPSERGCSLDGLRSPPDFCQDLGITNQQIGNFSNGNGISDVTRSSCRTMVGGSVGERCCGSLNSTELGNAVRRFSCQSLIGSDPFEFQVNPRGQVKCCDTQMTAMTSALSDDSLHMTRVLKHHSSSYRFDRHGDSERTSYCPLFVENGNAGRAEMRRDLSTHKAKTGENDEPAKVVVSSLLSSEDEEEEVDVQERRDLSRRRRENGCRFGRGSILRNSLCDSMICDKNFLRAGDDVSNLMMFCGTRPVTGLLRLFGMADISRHLCDLMPTSEVSLEKSSLTEFLLTSSTAGVSAEQLICKMARLTNDMIYGKFFHLYPERNINLIQWLKHWTRKGAVPLATLKYESRDGLSGDHWQHRILHSNWLQGFGGDDISSEWFSNSSTIRVSRQNIVSRWREDCDLNVLLCQSDARWQQLNVLGQVVNILREEQLLPTAIGGYRPLQTSHLIIPTHFKSGITIYLRSDSISCAELRNMRTDLPLIRRTDG